MLILSQQGISRPLPSAGFSLVELMVALTVGLVILAGVMNIFSSTVKGNSDTLKATRLNQELRAAMDIMTRDITRAGYWSVATGTNGAVSASGAVNLVNNPFTAGVYDLSVTGSCITYAYSLNDDQTVDDNEKFGFQLTGNELLSRTGGANLNCTPSPSNTWDAVTDANLVKITGLTFTVIRKCTNVTPQPTQNCTFGATAPTTPPAYQAPSPNDTTVTVRRVDITLEGELTSDPGVRRKLTESVRVRNDLVDRYGDGDDDDSDADDLDNTHAAVDETNNTNADAHNNNNDND